MKARITFKFNGTCADCPLEYENSSDTQCCAGTYEGFDISFIDGFAERHPDCPLEILEEGDG